MAFSASTVPALLENLEAAFLAAFASDGVTVCGGIPNRDMGREAIGVMDAEGEESAAAMGRDKREEVYRVQVVVSVIRGGGDQAAATTKAFELREAIRDLLAADRTVSGAVREAALTNWRLEKRTGSSGEREAALFLTVTCKARVG